MRVLFWNSALHDWTGISESEIIGTCIGNQFATFHSSWLTIRIKEIFQGGPPAIISSQLHPSVIECSLPGGEQRIQHTTIRAIRSDTVSNKYNALLAIQDITDLTHVVQRFRKVRDLALDEVNVRKEAEESLQKSEQRYREVALNLKEVNEELESFAYSVSHDLRAPLRAIRGLSDILLADYQGTLDDTASDLLDRIVIAASQMDWLIRDLLHLSRLRSSELFLQQISFIAVLEAAKDQLALEIKNSGTEIEIMAPLAEVRGDKALLTQVLSNLLSNAMKFIPTDRTPKIKVTSETINDKTRVIISDNGIGIAEEHQGRIFDIFERLHGYDDYPGTGIGLALVRKAMQRMGGTIGVESKIDHGSKFFLELPTAKNYSEKP
jgi:signal transduction histidine kinase